MEGSNIEAVGSCDDVITITYGSGAADGGGPGSESTKTATSLKCPCPLPFHALFFICSPDNHLQIAPPHLSFSLCKKQWELCTNPPVICAIRSTPQVSGIPFIILYDELGQRVAQSISKIPLRSLSDCPTMWKMCLIATIVGSN